MKTVIGLVGVKTSGKSTAVNIIKSMIDAEEAALADKLKDTCTKVFGLSREMFDSQDLKEKPLGHPKTVTRNEIELILKEYGYDVTLSDNLTSLEGTRLETPRRIAQFIGTEVLRSLGNPDIHCEHVSLSDKVTIVSDIRFQNEYEYFNRMDSVKFIPLYIAREKAELLVTADSHASETNVFKFSSKCKRLDNNGTIKELEANIKNALKGEL